MDELYSVIVFIIVIINVVVSQYRLTPAVCQQYGFKLGDGRFCLV